MPRLCWLSPRSGTRPVLLFVANSLAYLWYQWPYFVNKVEFAAKNGLNAVLWLGELPRGLAVTTGAWCCGSAVGAELRAARGGQLDCGGRRLNATSARGRRRARGAPRRRLGHAEAAGTLRLRPDASRGGRRLGHARPVYDGATLKHAGQSAYAKGTADEVHSNHYNKAQAGVPLFLGARQGTKYAGRRGHSTTPGPARAPPLLH